MLGEVKHFRRFFWLSSICAALLPASTFAMSQTVWNFENGQVPGQWNVGGMGQPVQNADGIVLGGMQEASFISKGLLPQHVQAVRVTLQSPVTVQVALAWHVAGTDNGNLYPLPFVLAGGEFRTMDLNVEAFPQWESGKVDALGLLLPPGSQVTLKEIRLQGWNPLERAIETLKSFWRFDEYLPNSINFVWGPVITFNPVATQELFTTQPPRGRSGVWVLYGVCLVCAGGAWLRARRKGRDVSWTRVAACVAAVWLLFDLRMGMELLSYAAHDWSTYIHPKPGTERTFRSYYTVNDVAERLEPYLQDQPSYVAIGPDKSPFYTLFGYYLYPHLPLRPEHGSGASVWFVYERGDISLTTDGRIAVGDTPVSRPGTVLERFSPQSFVFRVNP